MEPRDRLLSLLKRAFPGGEEKELREFVRAYRPALLALHLGERRKLHERGIVLRRQSYADMEPEAPPPRTLAERLVDDALQGASVEQLTAAVMKARPALHAQLLEEHEERLKERADRRRFLEAIRFQRNLKATASAMPQPQIRDVRSPDFTSSPEAKGVEQGERKKPSSILELLELDTGKIGELGEPIVGMTYEYNKIDLDAVKDASDIEAGDPGSSSSSAGKAGAGGAGGAGAASAPPALGVGVPFSGSVERLDKPLSSDAPAPQHPRQPRPPTLTMPGDPRAPGLESAPESQPSPGMPVPPQRASMGFAAPETPEIPIVDRTLASGQQHLLWVELAPELVAGSLAEVAPLHGLHEGDVLDVIVFPFPQQLALEGPRHGRIAIGAAGNRIVQAAWEAPTTGDDPARPRLYFAFRTPKKAGRHGLRCNLYCRGVLLQSHLVRVRVSRRAEQHARAASRVLDYNLSSSLDVARIPPSAGCRVSLFLNEDGHGTHSFRFVSSKEGVPEQIGDAHIEGSQLTSMVSYAREGLCWVAWGTEKPWAGEPCKFAASLDEPKLSEALILLAKRGANLWMEIAGKFSFVGPKLHALRELMREPDSVQIALLESADAGIPAALLYDYPLDEGEALSLCRAALAAIAAGKPLHEEPCFRGHCPSYEDPRVVCPGGFWGFRHDLGLPLHLQEGEVSTVIPRGDKVHAFAAISTDKAFEMRDAHLQEISELSRELGYLPSGWLEILNDRTSCLARLGGACQLVYFYCHGDVTSKRTPFLKVGEPTSGAIYAKSLLEAKIWWDKPQPLVILNGCRTTATSMDAMFSMVTSFFRQCNAAGLIGTEITNFELIACTFGRTLLRNFLQGEPLGLAVRRGRLELLRLGNPLGLMYVLFALPGLCLK